MACYGSALAIQTFLILLACLKHSWELALAGFAFGAAALLLPPFAKLVERVWGWIGDTLARIVNPITLMILFILVIVPFGFLARTMRWLNPAFNNGKDSELIPVESCPSKKSFLKPF